MFTSGAKVIKKVLIKKVGKRLILSALYYPVIYAEVSSCTARIRQSLSASKTRSKNDSEILIAFSERLLESTGDNQKTPTATKLNCYLFPKDVPLSSFT